MNKKTCATCSNAILMPINYDILCKINGVVSPDYSCKRHTISISKKTRHCVRFQKCSACENFIRENSLSDESNFGLCQLFSVRKFDGDHRDACSKFEKRQTPQAI